MNQPNALSTHPTDDEKSSHFSLTYQDETAGFHHLSVQVDQLNWHIVAGGSGFPIVLLSGFPQSWYAWRKVMPALAQHYTVLAIELPGLGGTDGPVTGYDTASIGKHLHDLIEHLGHKTYFMVSHDVGAWASVHLLSRGRESELTVWYVSPLPQERKTKTRVEIWSHLVDQ